MKVYAQKGGLGNFIHQTPAYRRIFEKTGSKVQVNFDRQYVKDCFNDCPFIEASDKTGVYIPDYDGEYKLTDYEYCFQAITGEQYSPKYAIYVDRPEKGTDIKGKYIVFTIGAGGGALQYQLAKRMTFNMLWSILDLATIYNCQLVFVGTSLDWGITTSIVEPLKSVVTPVLDDIRDCLYVINNASCVIANDTGLYHAAAALDKPIVVSDRVPIRPNGKPSCGIVSANQKIQYSTEGKWDENLRFIAEKFGQKQYI